MIRVRVSLGCCRLLIIEAAQSMTSILFFQVKLIRGDTGHGDEIDLSPDISEIDNSITTMGYHTPISTGLSNVSLFIEPVMHGKDMQQNHLLCITMYHYAPLCSVTLASRIYLSIFLSMSIAFSVQLISLFPLLPPLQVILGTLI